MADNSTVLLSLGVDEKSLKKTVATIASTLKNGVDEYFQKKPFKFPTIDVTSLKFKGQLDLAQIKTKGVISIPIEKIRITGGALDLSKIPTKGSIKVDIDGNKVNLTGTTTSTSGRRVPAGPAVPEDIALLNKQAPATKLFNDLSGALSITKKQIEDIRSSLISGGLLPREADAAVKSLTANLNQLVKAYDKVDTGVKSGEKGIDGYQKKLGSLTVEVNKLLQKLRDFSVEAAKQDTFSTRKPGFVGPPTPQGVIDLNRAQDAAKALQAQTNAVQAGKGAFDAFGTSLESTRNRIEAIRSALLSSGVSTKEANKQLQELTTSQHRLSTSYARIDSNLKAGQGNLADYHDRIKVLGVDIGKLNQTIDKFSVGAAKQDVAAKRSTSFMESFGFKVGILGFSLGILGGHLQRLTSNIFNFATAASKAVEPLERIQNLVTQLVEAGEIPQDQKSTIFDEINRLGDLPGSNIESVTQSFRKLLAVTEDVQKSLKLIEGISKATGRSGTGARGQEQLIFQLSQFAGSGQFTERDLKTIKEQGGADIADIVNKLGGRSGIQQLGPTKFFDELIKALEKIPAPLEATQDKLNKINNSLLRIKLNILEILKPGLDDLLKVFQQLEVIVARLKNQFDALSPSTKSFISNAAIGLTAFIAGLSALLTVLAALGIALAGGKHLLDTFGIATGDVGFSIRAAAKEWNSWGKIGQTILNPLSKGLEALTKQVNILKFAVLDYFKDIAFVADEVVTNSFGVQIGNKLLAFRSLLKTGTQIPGREGIASLLGVSGEQGNALINLFTRLVVLVERFKTGGVELKTVTNVFRAFFTVVAEGVKSLLSLRTALVAGEGILAGFGGTLARIIGLTNPIGIVINVILAFITDFGRFRSTIVSGLSEIYEAIARLVSKLVEASEKGTGLGRVINFIIGAFQTIITVLEAATGIIGSLIGGILNTIGNVLDLVTDLIDAFNAPWEQFFDQIFNAFKAFMTRARLTTLKFIYDIYITITQGGARLFRTLPGGGLIADNLERITASNTLYRESLDKLTVSINKETGEIIINTDATEKKIKADKKVIETESELSIKLINLAGQYNFVTKETLKSAEALDAYSVSLAGASNELRKFNLESVGKVQESAATEELTRLIRTDVEKALAEIDPTFDRLKETATKRIVEISGNTARAQVNLTQKAIGDLNGILNTPTRSGGFSQQIKAQLAEAQAELDKFKRGNQPGEVIAEAQQKVKRILEAYTKSFGEASSEIIQRTFPQLRKPAEELQELLSQLFTKQSQGLRVTNEDLQIILDKAVEAKTALSKANIGLGDDAENIAKLRQSADASIQSAIDAVAKHQELINSTDVEILKSNEALDASRLKFKEEALLRNTALKNERLISIEKQNLFKLNQDLIRQEKLLDRAKEVGDLDRIRFLSEIILGVKKRIEATNYSIRILENTTSDELTAQTNQHENKLNLINLENEALVETAEILESITKSNRELTQQVLQDLAKINIEVRKLQFPEELSGFSSTEDFAKKLESAEFFRRDGFQLVVRGLNLEIDKVVKGLRQVNEISDHIVLEDSLSVDSFINPDPNRPKDLQDYFDTVLVKSLKDASILVGPENFSRILKELAGSVGDFTTDTFNKSINSVTELFNILTRNVTTSLKLIDQARDKVVAKFGTKESLESKISNLDETIKAQIEIAAVETDPDRQAAAEAKLDSLVKQRIELRESLSLLNKLAEKEGAESAKLKEISELQEIINRILGIRNDKLQTEIDKAQQLTKETIKRLEAEKAILDLKTELASQRAAGAEIRANTPGADITGITGNEDDAVLDAQIKQLNNKYELEKASIQLQIDAAQVAKNASEADKKASEEKIRQLNEILNLKREINEAEIQAAKDRAYLEKLDKLKNSLLSINDILFTRVSRAFTAWITRLKDDAGKGITAVQSFKELFAAAIAGFGTALAQALVDTIANQENFLSSLGKFFGQILIQLGTLLISVGTAALAAGLLSKFFPFLMPILNPSGVGEGAAAVAIAVGTGLVAAGALLGGGGAPADVSNTNATNSANSSTGAQGQDFDAERDPKTIYQKALQAQILIDIRTDDTQIVKTIIKHVNGNGRLATLIGNRKLGFGY